VQAPNLPAAVMAYNYYEDLDEADVLIALNKTTEPAFMSGTVKILSK